MWASIRRYGRWWRRSSRTKHWRLQLSSKEARRQPAVKRIKLSSQQLQARFLSLCTAHRDKNILLEHLLNHLFNTLVLAYRLRISRLKSSEQLLFKMLPKYVGFVQWSILPKTCCPHKVRWTCLPLFQSCGLELIISLFPNNHEH